MVLFDLDGVLLDSRDNMERSWKQVRERLGVTVEFDKYFAEIGRPFGVIMQRLGLGDRAEEIEEVFRMASMENLRVARFYPGAVATGENLEARLDAGADLPAVAGAAAPARILGVDDQCFAPGARGFERAMQARVSRADHQYVGSDGQIAVFLRRPRRAVPPVRA